MACKPLAFTALASLILGGCVTLDRQKAFVGGGAVVGAVAGAVMVTGAPGPTTMMAAGAVIGGGAGYILETLTRPAPPRSSPAAP